MNCTIEGCDRKATHLGKTVCHKHYNIQRQANMPPCTEDGCDRRQLSRGLCSTHYGAAKDSGALSKREPKPEPAPAEPSRLFDSKVKAKPYANTNEVINKYLTGTLFIVTGPAGRYPISAGGADEAKETYITRHKEQYQRLYEQE